MRDRELTVIQHLAELRRRTIICVLALIAGSALGFTFFRQIIELLLQPARDLDTGAGGQLIFTEVTELLTTSIKVSFFAGFILAFPVLLYQVIRFVAPGLTGRERRYLLGFLPGAMLAFASGVAFGYFVLTPPALHFLLDFRGRCGHTHDPGEQYRQPDDPLALLDGNCLRDPAGDVPAGPAGHRHRQGPEPASAATGWWWPLSSAPSSPPRWTRSTRHWWRCRSWLFMNWESYWPSWRAAVVPPAR